METDINTASGRELDCVVDDVGDNLYHLRLIRFDNNVVMLGIYLAVEFDLLAQSKGFEALRCFRRQCVVIIVFPSDGMGQVFVLRDVDNVV